MLVKLCSHENCITATNQHTHPVCYPHINRQQMNFGVMLKEGVGQ